MLIKNAGVVSSFDIEIQLYVDDVYADKIYKTSSDLIFKVAIPEELQKEGRKFYVLRHHDGDVEKVRSK